MCLVTFKSFRTLLSHWCSSSVAENTWPSLRRQSRCTKCSSVAWPSTLSSDETTTSKSSSSMTMTWVAGYPYCASCLVLAWYDDDVSGRPYALRQLSGCGLVQWWRERQAICVEPVVRCWWGPTIKQIFGYLRFANFVCQLTVKGMGNGWEWYHAQRHLILVLNSEEFVLFLESSLQN